MKELITASTYETTCAKIIDLKPMTEYEKYFKIELPGGRDLGHEPGQFVMVSIPGVGEAPISISSSPTQKGYFELVVRNAGKVTGALHNLAIGSTVGIRGPFGTGFPVDSFKGNSLLFVCGGLGIVPLRSLINYVLDKREDFGNIEILLGCKEPRSLLFKDEIERWQKTAGISFSCTVDRGSPDWKGNVGLITSLIPSAKIDPAKTFSVVCGPPIMYKFVLFELLNRQIPADKIYVSLERHMKCGVGKCGHCQIEELYCCKDGPVFSYEKIKNKKEAI